MKAIIDTCVVVDVLQNREPFAKDAQRVFLLAANKRFTGMITAKAVTDIYYLTHRLTHDDKATRTILQKLFFLFEVVDTAGKDCHRALESTVADFEDAVMAETARRIGAECIITRNEKDYSTAGIKIYSPQAFAEWMEKEIV